MNTPASSTHFHALRVSHIQPDADDAVIVSFDVPKSWWRLTNLWQANT